MNPDTRKILEDFVERSESIQASSYLNNSQDIIGLEARVQDGEWQIDFHQPGQEPTHALLFNLRLFVGNKDDISIGRLAEMLAVPDISDNWKSEYQAIRKQLNDKLGMVAAEGAKGTITYRDVFDMFLFGALGHRSQKDRAYKLFQKWVTDDTEWVILYNTFHETVIWVVAAVINIGKATKEELQRHSDAQPQMLARATRVPADALCAGSDARACVPRPWRGSARLNATVRRRLHRSVPFHLVSVV
jgi:hypothetical protein